MLDTLRLVTDTPEDVEAVLKVMNKLAIDLGKQPGKQPEKLKNRPLNMNFKLQSRASGLN